MLTVRLNLRKHEVATLRHFRVWTLGVWWFSKSTIRFDVGFWHFFEVHHDVPLGARILCLEECCKYQSLKHAPECSMKSLWVCQTLVQTDSRGEKNTFIYEDKQHQRSVAFCCFKLFWYISGSFFFLLQTFLYFIEPPFLKTKDIDNIPVPKDIPMKQNREQHLVLTIWESWNYKQIFAFFLDE